MHIYRSTDNASSNKHIYIYKQHEVIIIIYSKQTNSDNYLVEQQTCRASTRSSIKLINIHEAQVNNYVRTHARTPNQTSYNNKANIIQANNKHKQTNPN